MPLPSCCKMGCHVGTAIAYAALQRNSRRLPKKNRLISRNQHPNSWRRSIVVLSKRKKQTGKWWSKSHTQIIQKWHNNKLNGKGEELWWWTFEFFWCQCFSMGVKNRGTLDFFLPGIAFQLGSSLNQQPWRLNHSQKIHLVVDKWINIRS